MLRSVCVFCGSSAGARPEYSAAAVHMGQVLAQSRVRLVYGGANRGLMGTLADACMEAGGEVTGVMPQFLVDKEIAHRGLTELQITGSMHERKARMADLSDAFVALPGGFGTLEEFCEVLTWTQLGLQNKPCGLLNVLGYFDPLLTLAERMIAEGFVPQAHASLIVAATDGFELIRALGEWSRPKGSKWVEATRR